MRTGCGGLYHLLVTGPENCEDERNVVITQVGLETERQYDGYIATDEVQFPLLKLEFANSASLPALQKKFMNLMAIRYHILCASLQTHPDVHPIKRLPVLWHVDDGQWPSPDKDGNEDESEQVQSPYNTV